MDGREKFQWKFLGKKSWWKCSQKMNFVIVCASVILKQMCSFYPYNKGLVTLVANSPLYLNSQAGFFPADLSWPVKPDSTELCEGTNQGIYLR